MDKITNLQEIKHGNYDFINAPYKNTEFDAENTFFTADLHIGHKNIIRFCKRPYVDVKIMSEEKEEKTKAVLLLEHSQKVEEEENYEFPPIQLLSEGKSQTVKGGKKAIADNARFAIIKKRGDKNVYGGRVER